MPQSKLVAAVLLRKGIQNAPFQPGAYGAVGGAGPALFPDDVVMASFLHVMGEAVLPEVLLDYIGAETGVAGIYVYGHDLILYRGPFPQSLQQVQKRIRIFPSGNRHGDPVPFLDQ